jgi:hypothetical protein
VATSGNGLRGGRLGIVLALAAAVLLTSVARTSGATPASWCRAHSGLSWRHVLARHRVPLSRTTSLVPWTLAHDGHSFFATVYSPSFTGVARVSATSRRLTKIKSFPDPKNDQADGAFDGRWLVWSEYHGFDSFDDFTVWAWDSRAGRPRQIGAATQARNGEYWESPWRGPDVRAGIATWVQGIGPDGLTAVHVYNLRTGEERVVREGHAQGSFLLAGHLVAWPQSPAPGAETRMNVASVLTGGRVPAPRALHGLHGVSGLATDGRRIAYPDAPYKSLRWSPSLTATPQEVVTARGLNHIDNSVQVGGRYVGFGIQPRVFVGDTRTRRYVEITGRGGWTRIDATDLLVLYATGSKKLAAVAPISFVPLRRLPPIPSCS